MANTENHVINVLDKYTLVDDPGKSVRIIATDAKIGGGEYDIVALIELDDGTEFVEWYKSKDRELVVLDRCEFLVLKCDSNSERNIMLWEEYYEPIPTK